MAKQVADAFNTMARYGESRHEAKQERREHGEENPGRTDGIFSVQTMRNYIKHGSAFTAWAKETHHVKTLEDARQYGAEYLQMRIDQGLSPWTVHLDTAALSKLYNCKMRDWEISRPKRCRSDITRSRHDVARDAHFNPDNHQDLVTFLRATGMRRCEVERVRPQDVNVDGTVVHIVGKGGKHRDISILSQYVEAVHRIAFEAEAEGKRRIFGKVSENLDIHAIRREFAKEWYEHYIAIGAIDYNGKKDPIYHCRGDKAGTWYYRGAMLHVSHQMGHEREDVIASSYL